MKYMNELTYGQYVKERRKELKLTRKDACLKLTISVQTLTRIEGDKVSISLETLEDFIHLFDVDVSAFLSKEVYKNSNLKSIYKFNKDTLSKTFIFLRNREGLSQSDLASAIGVSNNKISLRENGKSYPNVSEFKRLCDALKADPDEVFFNKIIPPKRIITLFEAPTQRFVRVFSSFALVIILGGISFSKFNPEQNILLPPHSQVDTPNIDLDEGNLKPKPVKKHKVTYKYEMINDVIVKEVEEGSKIPYLPLPVAVNGYQLVDYIYQNESFDFENYRIYSDITLYGDLEKQNYTVKYFAYDKKTILKEVEVPYLEGATPPSIDEVDVFDDKKFVRWSANTSQVTSDMEVYPLYDHYKTDLTFIDSNGGTFEPIKNYNHSYYGILPKPLSDFSTTFIGWFYNDKAFTIDTPLEEEMVLESRYLKEDVIKCEIKMPNDEYGIRNFYAAGYNLRTLRGYTYENKLATTFLKDGKQLEYPVVFDNNNISLEPIFDFYIEYSLDENGNIVIEELRNDSTTIYIPCTINDRMVSRIKNDALIFPNCSKLVIGAGDVVIEKDAFKYCQNVEELYLIDNKASFETVVLEDGILTHLEKLRVLELPLAIGSNNYPININTIGLNKEIKGLSLKFQNDFDFNNFFLKANDELLNTISFMRIESINEYPFNRRVDMNRVDLRNFKNLKKLDFIGTINDIRLLNASKFNGLINYSGCLELLELSNNNLNEKKIYQEYAINSTKDLTLYGNDKIYAKTIRLDSLKSLYIDSDVMFYPLKNLYLPDLNSIKIAFKKPRFVNLVKGNKINVYVKGEIPSSDVLKNFFEGPESDLSKSFNFVSIL